LHIPASVAEALRLPEGDVETSVQRALATALYSQGILSFGKARELAGMSKATFGSLLGERSIVRHYGPPEVAEDLSYALGREAE
jgi:predicted HTH domain antitoxin